MSILTVVDADSIVWASACTVETRKYIIEGIEWFYKKDAVECCKQEGFDPRNIVLEYEVDDLWKAKANMNSMLERILTDCKAEDYDLYLSSDTNFRKAKFEDYKQNRDGLRKPVHLEDLKDHIMGEWGARVSPSGLEADDMVAIVQTESYLEKGDWNHTMIAGIDKDLNQVPGWHFNWKAINKLYYLNEREADYNFWLSMLTGDPIDNIKGVKGIGPKKGNAILSKCVEFESMQATVLKAYKDQYGDAAERLFERNYTMLWILRELPE